MGTSAVPHASTTQDSTKMQPLVGEPELDAETALEMMKQSTHRLDEILQQLCAAPQRHQHIEDQEDMQGATSTLESDVNSPSSSDEIFSDALECQQPSSSSDIPIDATVVDQAEVQVSFGYESLDAYFQAMDRALSASNDQRIGSGLNTFHESMQKGAADRHDRGDPPQERGFHEAPLLRNARFASQTRNMAFCFVKNADDFLGTSPSQPPPGELLESNLTCNHFVVRLRQELHSCDHLLPEAKAESLIRKVLSHIEQQYTTTLGAIHSIVPDETRIKCTDNQPVELQWQQGTQVAQVHIKECEHGFQWGLLVMLKINSLFRAQAKQPSNSSEMLQGPLVSTLCQHTLFLPKSKYNSLDDDENADASPPISSTTDVFVAKQETVDPANASTNAHPSNAETPETNGAFSPHSLGNRALPELLAVYVRGMPDVDDDTSLQSTGAKREDFVKLTIQTVPSCDFPSLLCESPPFPRTRIVQAACSRFHTLLLSDLGMVFAFGHSVDGALGLGSREMGPIVTTPTLVDFFFDRLISVSCVACGGDLMAGAHSAAVSTDGCVYTWGVGIALGNGSVRSHAEPQLIEFPGIEAPMSTTGGEQQNGESHAATSAAKMESVACGGGFCVAVSDTGHAFAWGKWSDGRLGLGKIPVLNQTSRKYGRRRQFQSFQLTPKQIVWGDPKRTSWCFLKISCGEAHCIGLARDGTILSWGRGNHGQLGHGTTGDLLTPVEVAIANERQLKWRDVAAGENWSMALDVHGRVWTWGACGGAVLGHGSGASKTAIITETILQRHHRLLKQASTKSEIAPPPMPQLNWMRPQLVPSFGNGGIQIQQLSAGLEHAAAVSVNGDLYQWGESNGFSSLPTLLRSATTTTKRAQVSSSSDSDIGAEIVERVACGGNQVIVFTSGTFLARSMQHLHRQCEMLSSEHQELDRDAYNEVTSQLATDMALLVSGKRLFAHKLLLARRSEVFRDLILDEQRNHHHSALPARGGGEDQQQFVMELLLPQLRYDVARILLEYIYTDNFSSMLDPQSYLIRDVLRAAQRFKLPHLEKLCRDSLLESSSFSSAPAVVLPLDGADPASMKETGSGNGGDGERTLNDDLKYAFGDSTWSDATLVAEGKEIAVHRCVLIARSEYFRALFEFQLKHEHRPSGFTKRAVIDVDESYLGMLRILNFIYHDHVTLPTKNVRDDDDDEGHRHDSEETEQLLEDLIAADKYGLVRLKRLCEHAIQVDMASCLEVLAVADLVSAAHLKQVSLAFLQSNLPVVMLEPAFRRFRDDFPHLLEELYLNIRMASTNESLLRSWHAGVEKQIAGQREQDERAWKMKAATTTFPWLYLILSITFATLYLTVMNKQVHEYPFVPALNLVAIVGVLAAAFCGWS